MSKPLVVSIPHNLGKAEASRRLHGGLGSLKSQFGDKIASIEEQWTEDRLAFHVGVMGQAKVVPRELVEAQGGKIGRGIEDLRGHVMDQPTYLRVRE